MKLTVTNERERPVRVIVDRDDVNGFTLDAGDTLSYDTPPDGLIAFRALGGSQGDLPGDVAT